MSGTLFLVDGHWYAYQAFFGMGGLSAPDGTPTQAVYAFAQMLLKVIDDQRPDAMAVAFDTPEATFRHRRFADYKATRSPMPEDLQVQMPLIDELLAAFGVVACKSPGYEADDLLATWTTQARDAGWEVALITKDKDLNVLLDEHVRVYQAADGVFRDETDFRARYGVAPASFLDVLALMGDHSDNIPGVPGVGEKTALKLIREYGSLDELYRRVDEVTGKLGEKLREHEAQARLSYELATVCRQAPCPSAPEALRLRARDDGKLGALFSRLGFRRLSEKMGLGSRAPQAPPASSAATIDDEGVQYQVIDTLEALSALVETLRHAECFAFDTETTHQDPHRADLVGCSFAVKPREAFYLPFRAPLGETVLDRNDALRLLKPVLEDPRARLIGQNIKYDAHVMRHHGVTVTAPYFDTMIAASLCDPDAGSLSLDALAMRYLGHRNITITELIGSGKKQITMDLVPVADIARYAAEDADITLRLHEALAPLLIERGVRELFATVEMPVLATIIDMEFRGIALDPKVLKDLARELLGKIEALERDIHHEAGGPFMVSSTKQLQEVLYERKGYLRRTQVRKTKTGYSTDAATLEQLARDWPEEKLPVLLLDYRQFTKLHSTYAEALPRHVSERTGRVHTTFHQTTAITGRLSSTEPNLQNIPIRTEEGRRIRAAFVAGDEAHVLITADYSQIELRLLAHLSGDRELGRAFEERADLHRRVAARLFGKEEREVGDEERRVAKAVNFGLIYGQQAYGLASTIQGSVAEAQRFIDAYFAGYPKVRAFIDATIEDGVRHGGVRTMGGRFRPLPDLQSRNPQLRGRAEREAVNTVVQGSAAELIKRAMIALDARIRDQALPMALLLQIHDELLCEVEREHEARCRSVIEATMTGAMSLSVPLEVTVASGRCWQELK